jgi:NTP pyrophosphatase (non-canonical NTP hydrolase)
MTEYQQAAARTVQPVPLDGTQLVVALLGMVGEAGAVATAYKKQLRDGPSDPGFKARMREELGDVLWYVSALATHLDLDLGDVAAANLAKIADRWQPTSAAEIPFDDGLAEQEMLPRTAEFVFSLTEGPDGRQTSILTCNSLRVGDPITNASHIADGYCFHDIFHLAHAAVLGWSPVIRSLMKRKRKSNPKIDEAEDGGRAIAIEEGIAALVFSYASQHEYLEGKNHVDNDILATIAGMVAHLEVSSHRAADWEKAVLTGYAAWRELRRRGGGTVRLDMTTQTLEVLP